MDNLIFVPFKSWQKNVVLKLHHNQDGTFKSANEIAEITKLNVSVIKAILRKYKG